MHRASIVSACVLIASCAGPPGLGRSANAFGICFQSPPEKEGEWAILPEMAGWRLVTSAPIDPGEHEQNWFVTGGCTSAKGCREYWFQKDTGDIRYCVTNTCSVFSLDFKIEQGKWQEPEARKFVCTS